MNNIEFYKMSGSGNDFILIDNRHNQIGACLRPAFAKTICQRAMSVGADGLIIIEKSTVADFKWHFLNTDGSEADMCGNGARCAARFAYLIGLAGLEMTFETNAGLIRAEMDGEQVKIQMTDPSDISMDETINLFDRVESIPCMNTGVPHAVVVVSDVNTVAIESMGPLIRYHKQYTPGGINANFIQQCDKKTVAIRTYERGVEAETLACGTGAVAGAITASRVFGFKSPVRVMTRSGLTLEVSFTKKVKGFKNVFLKGDARVIYRARLEKDALLMMDDMENPSSNKMMSQQSAPIAT